MKGSYRVSLLAAALSGCLMALAPALRADEKAIATVNGKTLTEQDLALAEAEIGGDLGSLPPATKRRVLVEYLIENQLMADAAEAGKLASGAEYESRLNYFKRRALRETYFDKSVRSGISEADAKKYYDAQIAQMKPEEEIKASHILVESEDKAKELASQIAKGDAKTFAELAKANSKDPGTKDYGGTLGYFGRGQMVPQFEEAAFKLKTGEVSPPVQTQFGWHLIRVDDRRTKQPPPFDQIKDRLMAQMIHQKAQNTITELRAKAKLDYLDPEIKKQIETEQAQGSAPKKQ